MKYLKKYESVVEDIEEFEKNLKYFCDNHLSFLKDEGFSINIKKRFVKNTGPGYYLYNITIEKLSDSGVVELFILNEIEDEFIQFLEFLKMNYNIVNTGCEISISEPSRSSFAKATNIYSINDVINNTGDYKSEIRHLRMRRIKIIEIFNISKNLLILK